jgi:hypothetical protein
MPRPIAERIAELRKEIANIQALNNMESGYASYHTRESEKQRRAMAELRTLTEWKKP